MSCHDHTFQEDNYVSTYIMPLKGDIMNFQHHNIISYFMNEQNFKLLSFDKVASCIHIYVWTIFWVVVTGGWCLRFFLFYYQSYAEVM